MVKKFENIFTRFDTIHERDRQTDTARRHTQRLCMHHTANTMSLYITTCQEDSSVLTLTGLSVCPFADCACSLHRLWLSLYVLVIMWTCITGKHHCKQLLYPRYDRGWLTMRAFHYSRPAPFADRYTTPINHNAHRSGTQSPWEHDNAFIAWHRHSRVCINVWTDEAVDCQRHTPYLTCNRTQQLKCR